MTQVYTWPEDWYQSVSIRAYLWSGSQMSQSPWSGRRNVYGPHRQIWRLEMQLAPQEAHVWKPIGAFFSRLGGQAGLVRICFDPRNRPQYTIAASLGEEAFSDSTYFTDGTGFVTGGLPAFVHAAAAAVRGATTMVFGGLPVSITAALRPGDLFEIRRGGAADETPSLHEIVTYGNTNADGESGIEFRPPLRKGVAAGDQIVLNDPTCVMRAIDDEQGIIDVDNATHGRTGFTLIENVI